MFIYVHDDRISVTVSFDPCFNPSPNAPYKKVNKTVEEKDAQVVPEDVRPGNILALKGTYCPDVKHSIALFPIILDSVEYPSYMAVTVIVANGVLSFLVSFV